MLAVRARVLTSIPALRSYAKVYDPNFWVALSKISEPEKSTALRRIYYRLQNRKTSRDMMKVASKLSIDLGKFDRLLAQLDDTPSTEERHEGRLSIHALHAVRQALMMKAFSLISEIPNVSGRHDASIEEIFDMVLEMRLNEAVDLLCQIYPTAADDNIEALSGLTEPGYATQSAGNQGYDQLHRDIIKPLDMIDRLLHATTLAIAQAYGAYG